VKDILYSPPLSKQDSVGLELQKLLSTVTPMTLNLTAFGLTNTVGCTINYTKRVN
jgi:hypothetical protein